MPKAANDGLIDENSAGTHLLLCAAGSKVDTLRRFEGSIHPHLSHFRVVSETKHRMYTAALSGKGWYIRMYMGLKLLLHTPTEHQHQHRLLYPVFLNEKATSCYRGTIHSEPSYLL